MATSIEPSYQGLVYNTRDALLLLSKAIRGELKTINRRPHDRERDAAIRSGNVFIYSEHSSSIKRWTDGVSWSPSRIQGNFLLYRELEKVFPPGEKRKATERAERVKRKRSDHDENRLSAPVVPMDSANIGHFSSLTGSGPGPPAITQLPLHVLHATSIATQSDLKAFCSTQEFIKSLHGSLVDSYHFKENKGLCKKTISVKYDGQTWHLVSYYTAEDATAGRLMMPRMHKDIYENNEIPRGLQDQNFRVPVDSRGVESSNSSGPSHAIHENNFSPPAYYSDSPEEESYQQYFATNQLPGYQTIYTHQRNDRLEYTTESTFPQASTRYNNQSTALQPAFEREPRNFFIPSTTFPSNAYDQEPASHPYNTPQLAQASYRQSHSDVLGESPHMPSGGNSTWNPPGQPARNQNIMRNLYAQRSEMSQPETFVPKLGTTAYPQDHWQK